MLQIGLTAAIGFISLLLFTDLEATKHLHSSDIHNVDEKFLKTELKHVCKFCTCRIHSHLLDNHFHTHSCI